MYLIKGGKFGKAKREAIYGVALAVKVAVPNANYPRLG
jgi:hypothetical protein